MRAHFLALLCFLTAVGPARAALPKYSAVYVFGDSYSDVGNAFIGTRGRTPPSPPYYQGRFSNGPVWVEHIAGALGLPITPEVAGGTDYAVGGAQVLAPAVTTQGTVPSVPQQVALYLSQHGGKADPNALYLIEGGGNDVLNASGGSPQELGYQIALGLAESELLLRNAGARFFLVPNLLDISELPAGRANAAFTSAATVAVNTSLDLLLQLESYLQGIRILRVDEYTLFQAVVRSPTHFGFTDVVNPCFNAATGAVCRDPDHTLFWDVEHPTEFGHAFFAVTVEQALAQQQ